MRFVEVESKREVCEVRQNKDSDLKFYKEGGSYPKVKGGWCKIDLVKMSQKVKVEF